MSHKTEKLTATFEAAEPDGRTHTVNVYTTFIKAGGFEGSSWLEGMKRLETDDGQSCNRLDKGRYQVVMTGVILTSTDPSAP